MKFILKPLELAWGLYAWLVFAALVPPLVLILALLPSQAICRRLTQVTARTILRLSLIPLSVRHLERLPDGSVRGDARKTLALWDEWSGVIREMEEEQG